MRPRHSDVLDRLRVLAPTVFPVRVFVQARVTVEGACVCGSMEVLGVGRARRFGLRVKRASADAMLDTMIHEYAHALAWPDITSHGPVWGVHFAAAYKAAMGAE